MNDEGKNIIVKINSERMNRIAPLFDGWDETVIWSCLQGYVGRAWADNRDTPSAAQIIVGDIFFFAGDAGLPEAEELLRNIPEDYTKDWILVTPKDASWYELIERVYNGKYKKNTRYAFRKDRSNFDRNNLQKLIEKLPVEYNIVPIDENLYNWTKTEQVGNAQFWAYDFCSQFPSYNDYLQHGVGYVVLHEGEPVCGASSLTYYDGGIEIQIETRDPHRRKGLASACAAQLMLTCLDKGLFPSWDAANPESAALAKKLGYVYNGEYISYEITGFRDKPNKEH